MFKKRILWQLFPSYLLIIFLLLASSTYFFTKKLKQFYINQVTIELKANAEHIENEIIAPLKIADYKKLDEITNKLAKDYQARITIILPTGVVVADSSRNGERLENHAHRPEVIAAIKGNIGIASRYSHTLGKNMLYVAFPVIENHKTTAIIRNSIPLTVIENVLKNIYREISLGGFAIAAFAALISLWLSRVIKKPIFEIERGAEKFASGNLSYRLPVPKSKEIGALAESLNTMAELLDEKIGTITEQHNEQNAVFSSMIEGVIAVDQNRRIIKMNKAAARLLSINPKEVKGLKIKEISGKTELHQFIKKAFESLKPIEGVINLNNNEVFIQARSTVLRKENGENIGAVVVLNDITRLRKLENLRQEFVANVSHELRTPITSIKGFVETLMDGAIDDKDEALHFLEIIKKHTGRLNNIIEDLLSLSRIEQEESEKEIQKEYVRLLDVINSAGQACLVKADAKNIEIKLNCSDDIFVEVSPSLIEQAIVNLIDNALKYSPNDEKVEVCVIKDSKHIMLNVIDNGCGIPPEHISRIFERFYRVDKARSRKLGGTGLGLSIVKHIAQIHNGFVNVQSELNKGSVFSISLPLTK